jgi:hypothetical protein
MEDMDVPPRQGAILILANNTARHPSKGQLPDVRFLAKNGH